MRIQILADVGKGITLPINYNHLLVDAIYRFLAESNPEYADFLHEEGYHANEKRFKLFTFSQLMAERRRITGEQIHFRSTLTWFVSFTDCGSRVYSAEYFPSYHNNLEMLTLLFVAVSMRSNVSVIV